MFFDSCKTTAELTAEYRRAALKNHPDMGGDEEMMKRINAEFAAKLEELKRNEDGNGFEGMEKMPSQIAEMIQKIIHLDGIEIEICGTWVWVGGDTFPHRIELSKAGYKYSGRKKMWYFGKLTKKRYVSSRSMDDIRAAYGSKMVTRDDRKRISA